MINGPKYVTVHSMADASEIDPTQSPEQAVRSFREDLLAGSGFEYLTDSATIHYIRVGEDDFTDITATPGGIVTVKPEDQSGATIYSAHEETLLANDQTFFQVRVCPPDEVADFVENLGKRSPGNERITLKVDITPEQPDAIQKWLELWEREYEMATRTVANYVLSRPGVGDLTERFYPYYVDALSKALGIRRH